jgi:hypothetical protein
MKKLLYSFAFAVIFVSCQTAYGQSKEAQLAACLPSDVKLDTVVSATSKNNKVVKETVKQQLNKLKVQCKAGKLVDKKKREVRFFQLQGCWGNPPADYQEILDNQQKQLLELKKKHTVIEITCNASGLRLA